MFHKGNSLVWTLALMSLVGIGGIGATSWLISAAATSDVRHEKSLVSFNRSDVTQAEQVEGGNAPTPSNPASARPSVEMASCYDVPYRIAYRCDTSEAFWVPMDVCYIGVCVEGSDFFLFRRHTCPTSAADCPSPEDSFGECFCGVLDPTTHPSPGTAAWNAQNAAGKVVLPICDFTADCGGSCFSTQCEDMIAECRYCSE